MKLFDYQCPECDCVFEAIVDNCDVREVPCDFAGNGCWGMAAKIMSAPAIHTLETHMRGYRGNERGDFSKADGGGYWNAAHGEFVDENLTDPKTGKPGTYKTLAEKEALMNKLGRYQRTDRDADLNGSKQRTDRPMYFDGSSNRRDQLG